MQVLVENFTRYARAAMHTCTLPLADGVLFPSDAENALRVLEATGPGSVDWVQWSPLTSPQGYAAGELGRRYPSGAFRQIRVTFPVKLDAGAAAPRPGDQSLTPHYSSKLVTIEKVATTAQAFVPNGQTFPLVTGMEFVLDAYNGDPNRLSVISLNTATDRELFPSFHGTGNANAKWFWAARRVENSTLWHGVLYEVTRDVGGNGRFVRYWHRWGASDNRVRTNAHAIPNRVDLRVRYFADAHMHYDRIRLPETTPALFDPSSQTFNVLAFGSGTYKTSTGASPNVETIIRLFDPADRVGVGGITTAKRSHLCEGQALANRGVLIFPWPGTPTQAELDSNAAEIEAPTWGISQDWPLHKSTFQALGDGVPPHDWRGASSDRDVARQQHRNHVFFDLEYQRNATAPTDGVNSQFHLREPWHEPLMGTRPTAGATGDSTGFGETKGWAHAATGNGDVRAMEVSGFAALRGQSFELREVDLERIDYRRYHNASGEADLYEMAIPFLQGQPGFASWYSSSRRTQTINGKTLTVSDWGKNAQNEVDDYGDLAQSSIQIDNLGNRPSNPNYRIGTVYEGGVDITHSGVHNETALAQLTGCAFWLDVLDGIELTHLHTSLTLYSADGERFFRRIYGEGAQIPEGYRSGTPFATYTRGHGRGMQGVTLCHSVTGNSRLRRYLRAHLLNTIGGYAAGSHKRGRVKWRDPQRNRDWAFEREWSPNDLPGLWGHYHSGHGLTGYEPTNELSLTAFGANRRLVSQVRNWQGNRDRDMVALPVAQNTTGTLLDPVGGGWLEVPVFDSDEFVHDVVPARFRTKVKPIGMGRYPQPPSGDNSQLYGPIFSQPGVDANGINASGPFYLWGFFLLTRDAGVREFWGINIRDCVRVNYGTRRIFIVIDGTQVEIARDIPLGAVSILIWRDASNVVRVSINGDETTYARNPTVAGTSRIKGFGYGLGAGGTATGYFDDYVWEIGYGVGADMDDDANRGFIVEYMRSVYDHYERPWSLDEYQQDRGTWAHIPYVWIDQDQSNPSADGVSQSRVTLFQAAILFNSIYAAWRILREYDDEQSVDATDFCRRWIINGARWFTWHLLSDTISGRSEHSGEFVRDYFYLIATLRKYWQSGTRNSLGMSAQKVGGPNPDRPGEFLWQAASTWQGVKQYLTALGVAVEWLSEDKQTLARARDTLLHLREALFERVPVAGFPTGPDDNWFGFGGLGFDDSQIEAWGVGRPQVYADLDSLDLTILGDAKFGPALGGRGVPTVNISLSARSTMGLDARGATNTGFPQLIKLEPTAQAQNSLGARGALVTMIDAPTLIKVDWPSLGGRGALVVDDSGVVNADIEARVKTALGGRGVLSVTIPLPTTRTGGSIGGRGAMSSNSGPTEVDLFARFGPTLDGSGEPFEPEQPSVTARTGGGSSMRGFLTVTLPEGVADNGTPAQVNARDQVEEFQVRATFQRFVGSYSPTAGAVTPSVSQSYECAVSPLVKPSRQEGTGAVRSSYEVYVSPLSIAAAQVTQGIGPPVVPDASTRVQYAGHDEALNVTATDPIHGEDGSIVLYRLTLQS